MTPVVASPELVTSWTLRREGYTLICALVRRPSGAYVLRLRHQGRRVLDEKCRSPQQAVTRSIEAFHVLMTRGWQPANSAN